MGGKIRGIGVACILFALACGLAGCITVNVTEASSSSSGSSSAEESAEASSAASSSASSAAASSSSGSAASSAASSTSTASYSLGDVYFLDVYDSGSGPMADAAVEIVNTGDVPLVMGASSITIFDAAGNQLVSATGNGVFTGPSYLRTGDIGFIYTSGSISMPSGYSSSDDYKLTAATDVTACREVWEYPISGKSISDDGYGLPLVTGTVTNDDSEKADLVEVTVSFFDNDNELLGVAGDIIVNLEPGARKDFTITGYGLPVGCTLAMISDYDVIAVGAKY